MHLSNAIKQLRKQAKMTQGEFARAVGISQTAACQIEVSQRRPGQETEDAICRVLKISNEYLHLYAIHLEGKLDKRAMSLVLEMASNYILISKV